ncbi:MAG: acylhydrolase [Oscillospiraceae bacterium]|nr:acylhydrolase [Oscillospiraceae bacterium]
MKKSNLVTLLSLFLIIFAVILFMFFWKTPSASFGTKTESSSATQSNIITASKNTSDDISSTETEDSSEASTSKTDNITSKPNTNTYMGDALFIGDSRTVGLMEYAGIDGADYFCTVGMSVYNIHKKPVSVPKVGKVTLTELLNSKKYGKIYIMLGINEVGYKLSSTVEKYSELIEFIKDKQPNAVIFIQANLHVSKSRSDSDKVVNNIAINGLNAELAKLADGKSKFYLDANILFDDKTGALSSDKSEDSTHLYAKYYKEWGEWIIKQTASLIGEG